MKTKFILTSTLFLLLSLNFAHAEGNDPVADMKAILGCQATYVSLEHLHTQIAASMLALSGPRGVQSLTPMIKGYTDIAKEEQKRVDDISKAMKETLIPAFTDEGMPADMLMANMTKDLAQALGDISDSLADPTNTVEVQSNKEKALLEHSVTCDKLVHDILGKYTL